MIGAGIGYHLHSQSTRKSHSFDKMATLGVLVAFFAAATADTYNDGAPSGDYESYGALRFKTYVA